jgi:PKD repeat protein
VPQGVCATFRLLTPMDRSVMSPLPTVNRSLPLALTALALLVAGLLTASAQAASNFGEVGKFGKGGKGAGEFTLPPGNTVHAIGVDPADNSVFVGDEPKQNENGKEEVTSEYRIQKFSSTGTLLGSVAFKVESVGPEGGKPAGLEGIAIDTTPGVERVYALVVYEREEAEGEKRQKENEKLIKEGKSPLPPRADGEITAAGILYAFKIAPSGKVLVPAEGTTGEGVLASTAALHAQSETTHSPAQSALLEPGGIAVDPTTHDVIIVGLEDQGEESLLVAAQRVKSDGTLGARWVDTSECFEGENEGAPSCYQEEEQSLQAGEPKSPIVTPTGRVIVDLPSSEIWEIPKGFVSGEAPKPIFKFPSLQQKLLRFPGSPNVTEGGSLAFVAGEGSGEGKLYQAAEVSLSPLLTKYPSVLELELPATGAATEVGWTGGQNKIEHPGCAISQFSQPIVGAGKAEAIYVLDPNVPPGTAQETPSPHVVIFGPKGTECPTDSADGPAATASGSIVGTEANPAHVGQKVLLSSNVQGANALSVAWDFGDGTTQEVKEPQFLTTKIEHAFTSIGAKTVKETIRTDSLAEPTTVKEAKVVVAAAAPTAQFSISPGEVAVGQQATFDAKGSNDPNGGAIVKYVWTFGDGTEATTTTPSTSHAYSAEGTYTVGLKVTDELKLTSAVVKHPITVANPAPPSPETTPTTTTPPPTTAASPPPGNGVLPSQEHKAPDAKLASSSLTVSVSGGVPVKVSCPTGASCAGTVTLSTIGAVSAAKKKAVLTLATGSFSVSGGAVKTITLHLSAKARKLLAKSHTLRAKAKVVAHDSSGATRTSVATVTLKLAKKSH